MKLVCCLVIAFLPVGFAQAQDTHYWTRQIGTRSALMGGAVIASSRDNTALLYNPSLMAWIDTTTISITGNLIGIENIKIENALGQRADFKSSSLGSVPLLVGGMLPTKSNTFRMAYGIMVQSDFNFKANARIEGNFPLVTDAESPGDEAAIGQLSLQSKLTEQAAGIGFGKQLSDHWSFGLTGLFIVRSPNFSRYGLTRLYMNQVADPVITGTIVQSVDYYNVRFQPKLGVSWQNGPMTAGLVVSSPSLNLFGRGNIAFDATGTNIKPAGYTSRIDFVANDRQEKLKTTYKSPLSVSGGVGYTGGKSHLELSMQYFNKVSTYSIIEAEPTAFARPADAYPDLTSDKYLRVLTGAKAVFNAGLAWEYQYSDDLQLYASTRTDNSYFNNDINNQPGIKPDISSWNILHFVAGTSIQKGRSSISIGLAAAFGKDNDRQQTGNINGDSESNLFQGTTTITKASYSAIGLILGYTYHFKKF